MPESPYHLLKIGQRNEAIACLARLRSKPPASVQKEADEIQVIGKLAKKLVLETWLCQLDLILLGPQIHCFSIYRVIEINLSIELEFLLYR